MYLFATVTVRGFAFIYEETKLVHDAHGILTIVVIPLWCVVDTAL
jgi:hypothetical protein